jgi:hypothetical protein
VLERCGRFQFAAASTVAYAVSEVDSAARLLDPRALDIQRPPTGDGDVNLELHFVIGADGQVDRRSLRLPNVHSSAERAVLRQLVARLKEARYCPAVRSLQRVRVWESVRYSVIVQS